MRNTITIIDKDIPKVTIRNLQAGSMFRYPKNGAPSNVYMKLDVNNACVLLATGAYFSSFDYDAAVEVVDAISIQR